MNEIIEKQNWWQRNWKWFIPIIGFFIFIIGIISTTDIDKNISDIAKVYVDPTLCENAIIQAQGNEEVQNLLGTLDPIDKMAILEGRVAYSNNNTSVDMSVRVKGEKGKGRIRIIAERKNNEWIYNKIQIGIKKIGKTILITDILISE